MDKEMYKQLVSKLMRDESDLKDQLSHALQELGEVYHLVETTPNNMQLGKKVRQHYYENHE
tara:strand:- start:692 stop:874 length:183 start_codon:yes stop_codon:yes gene_type:complete